MSWVTQADNRAELLAELPAAKLLFDDFYASLWQQSYIAPATLELCRLRLAQLHRAQVEWQRSDFALSASQRQALSSWNSSEAFSAAEKACLAYAEVYAMDASAITDELAAAVINYYGEPGLVTLMSALGLFDGMTRMSLLWQLDQP
jgi:hypothetical protein